MYLIDLGTEEGVLNPQVVLIFQVVLRTGFTVYITSRTHAGHLCRCYATQEPAESILKQSERASWWTLEASK